MQQIAEWLAKIGLERYAPAFIDNDIDVSVLRYLTDADLEKIGVSLGHRRKLLVAIAALGGGETGPTGPAPEPDSSATRRTLPRRSKHSSPRLASHGSRRPGASRCERRSRSRSSINPAAVAPRPRRARARAGRLFSDPGISGDCASASASRRAREADLDTPSAERARQRCEC
jgi:hypothetical protein